MKQLVILFAALLMGTGSSLHATPDHKVHPNRMFRYGNSFIFVESGITFSVYPDGEFDFYADAYTGVNAHIGAGPVGITFNSGFNYNPYVQYDDYGAVIQVENTPIFYDYYGRVSRIGNINIWYRNGLAYRIGGMRIFYGRNGFYDYHTGYINIYNRTYVFQPFHRFFVRPAVGFCLVYNRPYRRYYQPVRYTYYQPYRNNYRRSYVNVGKTYRYADRAERSRVYRNDRRVSVQRYAARSENRSSYKKEAVRSNARSTQTQRSARVAPQRTEARSSARTTEVRQRSAGQASGRTAEARAPRKATSTPDRRTAQVTRSSQERTSQARSTQREAPRANRSATAPKRSAQASRSPQRETSRSTARSSSRSDNRRPAATRSNSKTRSTSRSGRSGQ